MSAWEHHYYVSKDSRQGDVHYRIYKIGSNGIGLWNTNLQTVLDEAFEYCNDIELAKVYGRDTEKYIKAKRESVKLASLPSYDNLYKRFVKFNFNEIQVHSECIIDKITMQDEINYTGPGDSGSYHADKIY